MITLMKRLLTIPTPLELAARELVQAQRAKLEAESACEYAASMIQYNEDRISRLTRRLTELQGDIA